MERNTKELVGILAVIGGVILVPILFYASLIAMLAVAIKWIIH